ncbi:MAG TPA: hypothetical protein VF541_15965, partial [Longimicrobium sp.]
MSVAESPPRADAEVVETDDTARWDAFVRAQPGGTVCHLSAWREVIRDALGHPTRLFAALGGEGEWTGVMPLATVRSRIFG